MACPPKNGDLVHHLPARVWLCGSGPARYARQREKRVERVRGSDKEKAKNAGKSTVASAVSSQWIPPGLATDDAMAPFAKDRDLRLEVLTAKVRLGDSTPFRRNLSLAGEVDFWACCGVVFGNIED